MSTVLAPNRRTTLEDASVALLAAKAFAELANVYPLAHVAGSYHPRERQMLGGVIDARLSEGAVIEYVRRKLTGSLDGFYGLADARLVGLTEEAVVADRAADFHVIWPEDLVRLADEHLRSLEVIPVPGRRLMTPNQRVTRSRTGSVAGALAWLESHVAARTALATRAGASRSLM